MSSNLEMLKEPIVAVALTDDNEKMTCIRFDEPVSFSEIDFQDDIIRIGNLHIIYEWVDSVVLCTEHILKELEAVCL